MTEAPMDRSEFAALFSCLADAWSRCDATMAADRFTDDAVYMEPSDRQLFRGRDELRAYFSPLEPGTYLHAQNIWFDPITQQGSVEFTFGMKGAPTADHGVVVIAVRHRRIAVWREYVRSGPASFAEFIATEGKTWEWHAGNYP